MTGGLSFRSAANLPIEHGAYVLAIRLDAACAVRGRGGDRVLPPGRYLYCGSAYGPGGLRARIARHLRRRKPIRWHVDRITRGGAVFAVWAVPGGHECDLVAALAGFPTPVPGFGSSDCRHCVSHLLAWPKGVPLPFGPPIAAISDAEIPARGPR